MIYDFTYQNPCRVHFGKSAMNHLPIELANYGKNILLVYGKGSVKKSGIYDQIMAILKEQGKNVFELSGINSNPRYTQVLEGCRIARENNVDLILAVGGGSVIDCAKAISAGTYIEGDLWERYYKNQEPLSNEVIPIGTVLTMAGTGSEMNAGSVITNEELHLKLGRVYPTDKVAPKFSIMNPEFTYSVPRYQMVSGIFDIFSHLMEEYFSGDDDNTSDYLLEGVMLSLIKSAKKAIKNPEDYEARSNIMWCATIALNTILGVSKKQDWMVHQIEHQLGAYTDCAHGIGLAVISPAYYRYIYKFGLHKFVRYAINVWGVQDNGQGDDLIALEGIACLEAFIRELGIPATLRDIGTTDDLLPLIATSTEKNYKTRYGENFTGYKKMEAPDIMEVLKACY